MYFYIYDSFLSDKKYTSTLNKIETRLMDLGINGRTEKLSILKSLQEIVQEAVKKGAETMIAVGDDNTVSQIIKLLPDLNITLGIIPIGNNNKIAQILGIPLGEAACDTISSRIIEKIDLGKANDFYFISSLEIPSQKDITMDCGNYQISPLSENETISICNFDTSLNEKDTANKTICNPKDGILEAVFSPQSKRSNLFNVFKKQYSTNSVFPLKQLKIKCSKEGLPVIADGQIKIKTPVTVKVIPKKLKVIVGKNRMF
ncbi:hypothetical protein KKF61_02230 [Patescibacteria group bacterium]|nr:hypothetical protein [Patescibacteria group bacterium]MBU0963829.1 hypothetical protein [Patescibacteria group bacterium]